MAAHAFDAVVPVAEGHDGYQFDVVGHGEQFFCGLVLVGLVEGDEAGSEAFRPCEYFHLLERAPAIEVWSVCGLGVHTDGDGQRRVGEKWAVGCDGADLLQCLAILDHDEAPRLQVPRAWRP